MRFGGACGAINDFRSATSGEPSRRRDSRSSTHSASVVDSIPPSRVAPEVLHVGTDGLAAKANVVPFTAKTQSFCAENRQRRPWVSVGFLGEEIANEPLSA